MAKITLANFAGGIQASPGFMPNARNTTASDIRNMLVDGNGRLVRRAGSSHKNGSALANNLLKVLPCYHAPGGESDAGASTIRTHLFLQAQSGETDGLLYWDGSAFASATLNPSPAQVSNWFNAEFDWVVAKGRLFLCNGYVVFWVDISADPSTTAPQIHWWGITPNLASGYTPTSMPSLTLADSSTSGNLTTTEFYGYVFTYYNSTYGIESLPSGRKTIELTGGRTAANLSGMTANTDAQVTHIRIYRTEGQSSDALALTADLKLCATLVPAVTGTDDSGVNNKATSMTDSTTDFSASGVLATLTVGFQFIDNVTDGSEAEITSISGGSNQTINFTGNLSGGSENDFDDGESYSIAYDKFVDTVDDDSLGLTLDSTDHDNPPTDLKRVIFHAGRIWGARRLSSSMLFTKIASTGDLVVDAFPNTNAIVPHLFYVNREDGDFVTAMEPSPSGQIIQIFKENSVTLARGTGLITGLYQPVTGLTGVDLDISYVNRSAGCIAPKSVATVGGKVTLFFGVDKQIWAMAGGEMQPISLAIQPLLDDIPITRLTQPVGVGYRNRYLLAFPSGDNSNDLIADYDLNRKYWTIHDLDSDDLVWATGGSDDDILYSVLTDTNFVDEYFIGTQDNSSDFTAVWQSNSLQLPPEAIITGIYVYPISSVAVTVRVDTDGTNGTAASYTPAKSNNFRIGVFARGRTFRVRISGTAMDNIERVEIEYELR